MTIHVQKETRSTVCLTFDFDAVSLWFGTFDNFGYQAVGRGEFGARVGVERILALLEDTGVTSTWFVPGHTAESWPAVTRAIVDAGHEIAHHGYCHENPVELGSAEEAVLVRGIEALVNVTGVRPVGYRSPAWETTDQTVELLLKHGFVYAANGMSEDFRPYRARRGDVTSVTERFGYGAETSLIEIPAAWHLSDLSQLEPVIEYPGRIAPNPAATESIWQAEFDYMHDREPGGVITYTFHPQVIGRGHRMLMLERLIHHIQERPDVWFARMDAVAGAWMPDVPGLWSPTVEPSTLARERTA